LKEHARSLEDRATTVVQREKSCAEWDFIMEQRFEDLGGREEAVTRREEEAWRRTREAAATVTTAARREEAADEAAPRRRTARRRSWKKRAPSRHAVRRWTSERERVGDRDAIMGRM